MVRKAADQEKPVIFQVSDPVYLVDIHFVFGSSESRDEYIKKTFDKEFHHCYADDHVLGSTSAFSHEEPRMRGHYLIWVKNKKDSYTLIHECFHAVIMVLGDCGVHLQPDNSDAGAYYIEYLVRSATKGLLDSMKISEPSNAKRKTRA